MKIKKKKKPTRASNNLVHSLIDIYVYNIYKFPKIK